MFLQALVELATRSTRRLHQSRTVLWAATLATVLVFAWVKLTPLGGETYRAGLGLLSLPLRAVQAWLAGRELHVFARVRLAQDATDLFALPAVALPLWLDARRRRRHARPPASHAAAGLLALSCLLAPGLARAELHARISTGTGLVFAGQSTTLHVTSAERVSSARYNLSLRGVGPVTQLALGGHWRRFTWAGLAQVGWFRGHATGHREGLYAIGASVDSSLMTWSLGSMWEWSLRSGPCIGFALGMSGSYFPLEHAPRGRVDRGGHSEPYFWKAANAKFWLGGSFGVDLGPAFKLGWRVPIDLSLGDSVGSFSLQPLLDLSYN